MSAKSSKTKRAIEKVRSENVVDKAALERQIAEYEQQAEMMFANYHRLKGAALALGELLKKEASGGGDAAADPR